MAEIVARTLDDKLGSPREKGIDVQLAIDLARTSLFEDEHDIAVLVSADTDLLPALELIVKRRGPSAVTTHSVRNTEPEGLIRALRMRLRASHLDCHAHVLVRPRIDQRGYTRDADRDKSPH